MSDVLWSLLCTMYCGTKGQSVVYCVLCSTCNPTMSKYVVIVLLQCSTPEQGGPFFRISVSQTQPSNLTKELNSASKKSLKANLQRWQCYKVMNFSIGILIANLYVCENRANMKLTHPNEVIYKQTYSKYYRSFVEVASPSCRHLWSTLYLQTICAKLTSKNNFRRIK